jgi:GDPmannose 4,6-dehydratase
MWQMLQLPEPEDLVIATGRTVSLKYFVERAFRYFDLDQAQHVSSDNSLLRPSDIRYGAASPARALYKLGWRSKLDVDGVVDALCETARESLNQSSKPGARIQ